MTDQQNNKKTDFNFNPFGGLKDSEILSVIVPNFDIDSIIDLINSKDQIIVELVGKKGRGKTLHLRYLSLALQEAPFYSLTEKTTADEILDNDAELILIDSIHHLNLIERNRLFKKKQKIILTTHMTKAWEYKIAGKPYERIWFRGIESDKLKNIIENRIKVANTNNELGVRISENEIDQLIKKYKDDYRGILNHLYDKFQIELRENA